MSTMFRMREYSAPGTNTDRGAGIARLAELLDGILVALAAQNAMLQRRKGDDAALVGLGPFQNFETTRITSVVIIGAVHGTVHQRKRLLQAIHMGDCFASLDQIQRMVGKADGTHLALLYKIRHHRP